jgi:hypothetical protein
MVGHELLGFRAGIADILFQNRISVIKIPFLAVPDGFFAKFH